MIKSFLKVLQFALIGGLFLCSVYSISCNTRRGMQKPLAVEKTPHVQKTQSAEPSPVPTLLTPTPQSMLVDKSPIEAKTATPVHIESSFPVKSPKDAPTEQMADMKLQKPTPLSQDRSEIHITKSNCNETFQYSARGWQHSYSKLIAKSGVPNHNCHDIISLPDDADTQVIEGKFAYGPLDKDMQDEIVDVYYNDELCSRWRFLRSGRTDSDGRYTMRIAPPFKEKGTIFIKMVLAGDGTAADSTLMILPAGSKFVVFDIDGTLTTSDSELIRDLFHDLYDGLYIPRMRDDAQKLVQAYANKNYHILYLTGRPYWLQRKTRQWLNDMDFPPGTVRLTDSNRDSIAADNHVGRFKAEYLKKLSARGYHIEFAYGNASTDIFAYQQAGIDSEKIFIVGEHAGKNGTTAIPSYTDHLHLINESLPVTQPE